MKYSFLSLLVSIAFISCKSNDPLIPPQELPSSMKGVYIVNEGGFGKSTASLTFYAPDSEKVYPDIFFAANNRSLGDVANDMAIVGNKGFIVVNNSHKIEIISTETHASLGTIQLPGNSPYNVAIVDAEKAYVTNYYKGTVTVFNPTTHQVGKEIPVGKNPKGIVVHNNKVFVCNSGDFSADSTVTVIDAVTDVVSQTIVVGPAPNDVAVDSDGDILVRCYGFADWANPLNDKAGRISIINSSSGIVSHTIDLPLSTIGHPGKMAVSQKGYGYLVTASQVMKFDTKNNVMLSSAIKRGSAYSVAIDDINDRVYVTDAKDFVQNGTVFIYNSQGNLLDSLFSGIVPGKIVFKK